MGLELSKSTELPLILADYWPMSLDGEALVSAEAAQYQENDPRKASQVINPVVVFRRLRRRTISQLTAIWAGSGTRRHPPEHTLGNHVLELRFDPCGVGYT